MQEDRREFRRQEVRFPLECRAASDGWGHGLRAVARNISTGGVAFEMDLLEGMASPQPHALLDIELAIPPGEGHSPYQGSIRSVAEVLRCEPLSHAPQQGGEGRERVRIAARFREPLKLDF
jgi:hypothetical protein